MGGRRSLVGCSPRGREESDTTERLHFHLSTLMHWRRKWQPTPVFLPGESQGRGAWWAAVSGVAQSPTRLKRLSSSSSSRDLMKKTPVLNECPRVGPGKRIQKRGQTVKEANLDILVLLTPVFFLIPWKASTPCNLTKMQIKTMRYCLTLVKNDLCQNVYKQ